MSRAEENKTKVPHCHSYGTKTVQALVDRGVADYTAWQERSRGGRLFPIEITVKALSHA